MSLNDQHVLFIGGKYHGQVRGVQVENSRPPPVFQYAEMDGDQEPLYSVEEQPTQRMFTCRMYRAGRIATHELEFCIYIYEDIKPEQVQVRLECIPFWEDFCGIEPWVDQGRMRVAVLTWLAGLQFHHNCMVRSAMWNRGCECKSMRFLCAKFMRILKRKMKEHDNVATRQCEGQ